MDEQRHQLVNDRIAGALAAVGSLRDHVATIERIASSVVECLAHGGTIYTCGNGGSAAEAMHLAEELIGRYRSNRRPLPAVCLNADPTALTCTANDFGFDEVFARPAEALLRPGDALVVFSTSGRSVNLVRAMEVAAERNAIRIALLGRDGGPCASLAEEFLIVPAEDSAHIQEAHQVVLHIICEAVEQATM